MTTLLRFLQLTAAEDAALRTLEQSDGIQAKVRLRASIIRLNASGMSVPRLVEHFQRNPQSIHNDLDRYETRGVAGLADGRSPGPPPRLTPAMEVYVQERLAEPRLWNSALLSEALQERFEVTVSGTRCVSGCERWAIHGSEGDTHRVRHLTRWWCTNIGRRLRR